MKTEAKEKREEARREAERMVDGLIERAQAAGVFDRYEQNLRDRLNAAMADGVNVGMKELALKVIEYQKIFIQGEVL